MNLELKRLKHSALSTQGELYINGTRECFTLERPWLNNASQVSCIPVGTYKIGLHDSPHFKRTLPHLLDVPGRDFILIHPANYPSELKGCIATGGVAGTDCIYQSRAAFATIDSKIKAALARREAVTITIQ